MNEGHTTTSYVARGRRWTVFAGMLLVVPVLAWRGSDAWAAVSRAASLATPGQVYTVADLARQVARDRVAWVGPTLRVRGMIVALPRWVARSPDVGGTEVILTRPRLVDQGGVVDFPLVTGPPDPLLVDARRLPLIGRLLPPAQSLQRGPSITTRHREYETTASVNCGPIDSLIRMVATAQSVLHA